MTIELIWEGGPADQHCWLDNGLHVRVTEIQLPNDGPVIFVWDVEDPMTKTPIAASVYESQLLNHPRTMEAAKAIALRRAHHYRPYGS